MKYSFVLPAYKAAFLKQAISSILAQTYSDFELIIVNDASPENLDSIVYTFSDNRIRYYKNAVNKGATDLVAQWNHCLGYSKCDYVILASDDDVYMPSYLEEMNQLVEKYSDVDVFRPRIQHIDANGNIIRVESVLNEYVSEIEYHYYWIKNWILRGIPFYVFKRVALTRVGNFHSYPLAWCSDDDIVMRLLDNGMVTSNKILFSFRLSGESISTRKSSVKDVKAKSIAIYTYYLELKRRLESIESSGFVPYQNCMLRELKSSLNYGWVNNEISSLCYKVTYKQLLQLTSFLLTVDTIDFKELLKIHFRYVKQSLFNLY